MNPVERALDTELLGLLDRLASSLPAGIVPAVAASSPLLRPRLDEVEGRLAELRGTMLTEYGRWQRALEYLENLWALASWRSVATQEPVEQTTTLAA